MSKNLLLRLFSIILLAVISISCGEFRRLQKSDDWEQEYDGAMRYYAEKEYYKATVLFEEVLPIIKGSERAELAEFYNAYAHYYQKQYILSGHFFEGFARIYSRSEHALEASYMHAYSLYLQSPEYNLDQTPTYEAVTAMQNFINKYPYSEYKDRATEIIDQLQTKLELKAYESSKQYEKLRMYEAALIAFENFRKDFPDSDYNEEIKYLKIRTHFEFARNSTERRRKERYTAVIDEYYDFIDDFPRSRYLLDAEDLFGRSVDRLSKVKTENTN